jgi:hemoglobin
MVHPLAAIARRAVLVFMLCGAGAAPAADDALYRALGAREGIQPMMADLVERARADARIGPMFKDTNPRHLTAQLTDQVCEITGGPCRLDGPDMKAAHESLEIRKGDFNRLVELLQQVMSERGVAFGTQNRLLARLAPMHRQIVNAE